jgi:hypothetical protein
MVLRTVRLLTHGLVAHNWAAVPHHSASSPVSDPYAAAAGQCLRHDRPPASAAAIETKIGNHTFRATGIQLYDRRRDEVTLDEVERILI